MGVFVLSHGALSHTEKLLTITTAFSLVEVNSGEWEGFGESSSVGFNTPVLDD